MRTDTKRVNVRCSVLAIGASLICFQGSSLAHDGQEGHSHSKVRKLENTELYNPTLMPDRIVLTWAGDPTNSQSVTWRTSVDVDKAYAELAVATSGPEFAKNPTRLNAESVALKTDLSTAHYHSVNFKDLTPGTKYAYRVGDGLNWSEWFQFKTAKVEQEPFSFIYFGDAQNDIRSMWSRVIREAYSDAPKAKFLLHAGDLINSAQADGEWGEWFGAGAWLNATIPNVPVVGNHEMHKGPENSRSVTHHWRPQFTLPSHGPQGLEETCYSFVYQNTRFVILNSNLQLEEQAKWLDKTLSENTSPWIVCTFHHPVFSTAKDRDNVQVRSLWKPILDKYNLDQKQFMVRVAEDTQLYQVIHIDGMKLRYESRTATGELYDAFELTKEIGLPNTLLEIPPEVQERRRQEANVPAAILPGASNNVPATSAAPGK